MGGPTSLCRCPWHRRPWPGSAPTGRPSPAPPCCPAGSLDAAALGRPGPYRHDQSSTQSKTNRSFEHMNMTFIVMRYYCKPVFSTERSWGAVPLLSAWGSRPACADCAARSGSKAGILQHIWSERNTRLQLKKADVRRWLLVWRVQLPDRVLYTTEHCIYPTQRLLWWSPIPAPTNWVQETLSVFTQRKLCGRRGNFSLLLCQSAKHREGNISVMCTNWFTNICQLCFYTDKPQKHIFVY